MATREDVFRCVAERYGVEPEYLWARLPRHAVLRCWESRKWFAVVMDVPADKLGLFGDSTVDVMDVKCDPLLIGAARREKGVLPAYHMNKDNWITLLLDGTAPDGLVFDLLDLSYELAEGHNKKSS